MNKRKSGTVRQSFFLILTSFIFISGTSLQVSAADPEQGRTQAATCTACHGYKGITVNTEWPNLAGQKEAYLVMQMKAFRDGSRTDPVMFGMLDNYSDTIIENIAAWFSSLPSE